MKKSKEKKKGRKVCMWTFLDGMVYGPGELDDLASTFPEWWNPELQYLTSIFFFNKVPRARHVPAVHQYVPLD